MLNVHCIDFSAFIRNEKLSKGITRDVGKNIVHAQDAGKVLIIDDSVLSGKSMLEALSKIPSSFQGEIITATVYSCSKKHHAVDVVFTHLEPPRVFEWNLYHHPIISDSCFDIDGVLCYDPT